MKRITTKKMLMMLALVSALPLTAMTAVAQEAPPEEEAPDPAAANTIETPRGRPKMMPRMHAWIEDMKKNDPEQYERLMTLRKEDPQAFRREIHKQFGERMERHMRKQLGPEEKKTQDLAAKYQAAADPDEKAEIKERLEAAVQAEFDARIKQQEDMLAKMEQRLNQLREHLSTRKNSRDKICSKRVEALTASPEVE